MRNRTFALAALLIGLGFSAGAHSPWIAADTGDRATNTQNKAARLKRLRAQIKSLQQELNQTVHKRDAEHEQLRRLERKVGDLVRSLKQLGVRLQSETRKLTELKQSRTAAHTNLRRQRYGLEKQLRAAYIMGRREHLKILLNQNSPATVARVLTYYGYLNRARMQQIGDIESTLVRLTALEADITDRTRELKGLRTAQTERRSALDTARRRRAEVVAVLNQKVLDQTGEIARLRLDEQRLERLLTRLRDLLADVPRGRELETRFRDRKGKLPLPATGKILARFGAPRKMGKLRWKGLFLGGREGQDIISVARGRVAFADWLRGFGLLLILEHGDGYMTLYGHNQALFAQVGDWVEAGQVVASMGSTGDAPQSGVYFEVRQKGRPRDPLVWCRLP